MYRDEITAGLDFKADLYAAPSPRRESAVVRRLSFGLVGAWVAGWLVCFELRRRYGIAHNLDPKDLTVLVPVALPVLLLPAFPLYSLVRLLFTREVHSVVTAHVDEAGLKITGPATSRVPLGQYHRCLCVKVKSKLHVVIATEGADAPLSLHVPEAAAHQVAAALGRSKMDADVLSFPIRLPKESAPTWYGKMISNKRRLKRASVALLCGGYTVLHLLARMFGEWYPLGIFMFLFPLVVIGGIYLVPLSWAALIGDQDAGKLTVNAAEIFLDDVPLCWHTDQVSLRIFEEESLEIRSHRISEGKIVIKPWQPGDRLELELIRATIEAFRARVSTGVLG